MLLFRSPKLLKKRKRPQRKGLTIRGADTPRDRTLNPNLNFTVSTYPILKQEERRSIVQEDAQLEPIWTDVEDWLTIEQISYIELKRIGTECWTFVIKLFCVWNPEEPKRMFWDIVSMIFIFIQMLSIPLVMAFSIDPSPGFVYFDNSMNYFFMVDVIISFQTAYYDRGTLISERGKIALNYVKFWFWIDVVSSFPYDMVITDEESGSNSNTMLLKFVRFLKFIRIVRLLRALKLKRLFGKLEESLSFAQAINSVLSFLKLCLLILCIAHWCACLWYIVSQWEDATWTWMDEYQIAEESWYVKYISALYFRYPYYFIVFNSVTTMITVGYGDITAVTTPERLYTVFFMILASGVFGYSMNSIMVLFQNSDEEVQELNEKITVLKKYMKQKDVPIAIQSRVKGYLEWLCDSQQMARTYEQQLIENLSANLKIEIISLINGRIIRNISFIRQHSPAFMYRLAFLLTEKIHGPEEYVFDENEINPNYSNRSFYYILNGSVLVLARHGTTSTYLGTMEKGMCFGEIGFFADVERTASIQTYDFVNLLTMTRQAYRNLARSCDSDLQIANEIKYFIEIENNISRLKIRCFTCKKMGHVAKYCPKMHFIVTKFQRLTVLKRVEAEINVKAKNLRNNRKKCSSLRLINMKQIVRANSKMRTQIGFRSPPVAYHQQRIQELEEQSQRSEEDDSEQLTPFSEEEEENGCKPPYFDFIVADSPRRRHMARESFQIDRIKTFEKFMPAFNFTETIFQLNANADIIIKQLFDEKEKRRIRILSLLDKFQNPQITIRKKVINISHRYSHHKKIHTIQEEAQQKPSRNQQRLRKVASQRKAEKERREAYTTKQQMLSLPPIPLNNNDDCSQFGSMDEFQIERVPGSLRPRWSSISQTINSEEPIQNVREVIRFRKPVLRSRTTTHFKDSQTTNISFRYKPILSKSLDIHNRIDPINRALVMHRTNVLENMLYLTINHQLQRAHRLID